MNVSELFCVEDLEKEIAEGFVVKRKHPTLPLYILNYTNKAQFDWHFNDVTINCRGLIVDEDYNIVAKGFPKFFSYEQLNGILPKGKYIVEEKVDGSLIIAGNYKGTRIVATRGSFESEQAIDAVRFLPENFCPHENVSWVFEYVANTNKIVVNYDYEGLVLLGILHNEQEELEKEQVDWYNEFMGYNFRRPKLYTFNDITNILNYNEPNEEGFILKYENNTRVKIKTELYKHLHRLLTGFNEKNIWEALRTNTLDEVLETIPDEMFPFVKTVENDLISKFETIQTEVMTNMKTFADRKSAADYFKTQKYPHLMFGVLDGKDISADIWKLIKPKVFNTVSEDAN